MQTLTADGDTEVFMTAGVAHIHVSGGFGGGSLQLKYKDDGGTWRDISDAGFLVAVDKIVELKPGTLIKGTLSGSTAPTLVVDINV